MTIPKNRLISGIPHWPSQSPVSSARRPTSATVSVGAPGRLGNVATPRSKRTSASAMRRRRTRRRSVQLASEICKSLFQCAVHGVVVFGIETLSHDVVKGANCDAILSLGAQRHELLPREWAQMCAHEVFDTANHGNRHFPSPPQLAWAKGDRRYEPPARSTGKNPVTVNDRS